MTRAESGTWALNGAVLPGLDALVDLDFGFTPATNLPQLRRIALPIGGKAVVPVVWLDVAAGTIQGLQQSYERRREERYWYESPTFSYVAELEVNPSGFVRRYPRLWEVEP